MWGELIIPTNNKNYSDKESFIDLTLKLIQLIEPDFVESSESIKPINQVYTKAGL